MTPTLPPDRAKRLPDSRIGADRRAHVDVGRAFALLALVQATLIFTIALITVPLPAIGQEFGLASSDLVLVLAAYGLPFSGLLLFGGRLTDRYGGTPMFAVGLAIFGTSSLLAAFAPGFAVLVALRGAEGVGGAIAAPAAIALVRSLYADRVALDRAMATWGGVSVFGAVAGFVASGILTTWISWRWMFAVPVIVAAISSGLAPRILPDVRPTSGRSVGLDPLGAVLASGGISTSSFGLISAGEHPWASAPVAGPLTLGLVLLAAFTVTERHVADPLLPPGFIHDPRRATGLVGMLFAAAGSAVVNLILSLYLQQQLGWSPLSTSAAFVPFAIALLGSSRGAAPMVVHFGPGRTTGAGLAIGASGFLLLGTVGTAADYGSGLLPGLVLVAVGIAIAFAGSAVLSTADVPPEHAGLAGGVMNTAMELGPTVGLAVLMSVAATQTDAISGYSWAFNAAAIGYLIAGVSTVMVDRRT